MSGKKYLFIIVGLIFLAFFMFFRIGDARLICKSPNIIDISDEATLKNLISNNQTYLGMFYSLRCPSCHKVAKILDKVEQERKYQLKYFTINISKFNPYKLRVIPRFIIYADGDIIKPLFKIESKEELLQILKQYG